jgi:hypothetical protein
MVLWSSAIKIYFIAISKNSGAGKPDAKKGYNKSDHNLQDGKMKPAVKIGDYLFEPISGNEGEVMKILDHPDGKLVFIRWRMEGQLHHDTEHLYSKLIKSIKKGHFQHTPKPA